MDITSVKGKALVDRSVLRRLLAVSEEKSLDRESTQFDIGFEACKREIRKILVDVLPVHKRIDPLVELQRELRNDT